MTVRDASPATLPARDSVRDLSTSGVLTLPGALPLEYGGILENVRVAWRLHGTGTEAHAATDEDRPLVAVLGGISATREVYGTAGSWWQGIVGPGLALDSTRHRILGIDYLGGSGQTSGPRPGQADFPSISACDQAAVLDAVALHLGAPLDAIVGASYGGMVALAFAERYPARVGRIVVISAADRSHPMATAWRSVQRAMVRYALVHGEGAEGLKLARALAMATYRSPREFAERFSAQATPGHQGNGQTAWRFPVEDYLFARGDAYAQRYLPEAFLCLSESIDLHRVDATRIRTPVTLAAVREDQLVPFADMRALLERLGTPVAGGAPHRWFELSSTYGHDAFLKEAQALATIFEEALS